MREKLPFFDRPAFLAPMAGVTDLAMRQIAEQTGAGLTISEMVASESYVVGGTQMGRRAVNGGIRRPVVQLAGCEPQWISRAARMAQDGGAMLIDINMGCPSKRVNGSLAGAALMRDEGRALELIEAVMKAVEVPVSVKMRLGWDEDNRNAASLAKRAEAAGVAMITVHGRTREQFYKGRADWSKVAEIRAAISIPLVINGDIDSLANAREALAASGANAVMVGRAAVGRPWLVGQIAEGLRSGHFGVEPDPMRKCELAGRHLNSLVALLGAKAGLRHARKHLDAYAQYQNAPRALQQRLVTTEEVEEAHECLIKVFSMEMMQPHILAAE